MATSRTLGGVSHSIPALGESGWGANLSTYLIAIADSCLATDGGTRSLTAELNLGTSFGLKSLYLKSTGSNVGSTGVIRLANAESIVWRNAANSADLALKVTASNVLDFNGSTVPTVASKLSVFAATSSAELATVISDETGAGALVFNSSPTLVSPVLGDATGTSLQLSGLTASRAMVTDGSKNLASSAVTGTELGYLSGVTSPTGSGALVLATSPTLVTPALGVASATTINKVALTAPASGATLTLADGKTLTVSNTLTFTGTDSSSVAFGTGGTVAYTANKLSAFASTSSAELAGVISDETGSGALVFGTSPTLTTPVISQISNTGTLSLPTATDTLVARATTDTLSNKTLASPVVTTAATFNAQAELRLADSDSTNYVGFKAPATVGANKVWVLPDADGSGNQALSTNGSGTLIWQTVASSSVATPTAAGLVTSFAPTVQSSVKSISTNSDYTITTTDGFDTVIVSYDGLINVTLPAAADNDGRRIRVIKTSAVGHTVKILRAGADVINGALTEYALFNKYGTCDVWSDGTSWHVMNAHRPGGLIRYQGGNGHGSTNTMIRRLSSVVEESSVASITAANTAADGASFTINEAGIYAIHYTDYRNDADVTWWIGISKNSNQLTTGVNAITAAHRLAYVNHLSTGDRFIHVSVTIPCVAGDVIRPHTGGAANGPTATGDELTNFTITQVGKL